MRAAWLSVLTFPAPHSSAERSPQEDDLARSASKGSLRNPWLALRASGRSSLRHEQESTRSRLLRALPIFVAILLVFVNCCLAELPSQTQRLIEKSTEDLASVRASSKQFLLDRFEKKLELTQASTKLAEAERPQLIASLEAERALFAKQEALPFSPTMRPDLIAYFGKVKKAEASLAKAYDNGIEYYSRKSLKDDAAALATAKQTALAPQVIAVWALNLEGDPEHVYNRTLKSDGTTQNGSWTMDENKIILRSPNPQAPGGAWILTCTVKPDGRHLEAVNQTGNKFEGKLIVE